MSEQLINELIDTQAIRQALFRYCRGLDRMDKAMAYGVFHHDSTVNYHGMFQGTGHGFVDWVWQSHEGMERHSHQITNQLIELDGKQAVSEAYVSLVLWTIPQDSGEQTEIQVRGRYLDRWQKREGLWAIVDREYVQDMQTDARVVRGYTSDQSTRDRHDASWRFFAQ